MARESGFKRTSGRKDDPVFWPQSAELFLFSVALLFYYIQPNWAPLHFAEARIRNAGVQWLAARSSMWAGWRESRRSLNETRDEIEKLRADLELTRAELKTEYLQVLENDALRSMFFLPKRANYRYVYAEVVSKNIRTTEARMFMRVTEKAGSIARGSPVIAAAAPNWAVVGQVMETHNNLVEVMLISDPRSRLGVIAADSPSYGSALLVGAGVGRLDLDYAAHPHFMKVLSPRLLLVTSPESRFPPGLAVAQLIPENESSQSPGRLRPEAVLRFEEVKFAVILIPEIPEKSAQ